jgi:hypothetical protein
MENINGMQCETVTVVGQDGGPLIVNKSDFDANPGKWTLFGDAATEDQGGGTSIEYDVKKDGKRFYVIDKATGVVMLDPAGYANEGDAWNAVGAVIA